MLNRAISCLIILIISFAVVQETKALSKAEANDILKQYKWQDINYVHDIEANIVSEYLAEPAKITAMLRVSRSGCYSWDTTWLIKQKGKKPVLILISIEPSTCKTVICSENSYLSLMKQLSEAGIANLKSGTSSWGGGRKQICYYTPTNSVVATYYGAPPANIDISTLTENMRKYIKVNNALNKYLNDYRETNKK